jgi:hypothetical protein
MIILINARISKYKLVICRLFIFLKDEMNFNLLNKKILIIDVESIGIHGEGYAVAGCLYDNFKLLDSFIYSCDPNLAEGSNIDRKWVEENIPKLDITHNSTKEVRTSFLKYWIDINKVYKNVVMAAECSWPVEANFISKCISESSENNNFNGPYPLYDISSIMASAGMDPLATYMRVNDEIPKHNPLCDVKQSSRLLYKALSTINSKI